MRERRNIRQQEAYIRSSDRLPFGIQDPSEKKLLGKVIYEVLNVKGDGKVVFPEQLNSGQQDRLRQRLDRNHGGFASKRIEFITTIPLEEGVGTMIGIRGKR
jgi:hypothetical protein